jgi:hypothetical protein
MATEPRPRTASEVWQMLVDEAGEDEVERAANMSVEDVERELAAMGFDVAAERAKAEDFLEALERGEDVGALEGDDEGKRSHVRAKPGGGASAGKRKGLGGRAVLLAAAATVAVGGAAYAALHKHAPAPPSPAPSPTPSPDMVAAAELRKKASDALEQKNWLDCLTLLDDARAKDPAGDAQPEVVRTRRQAEEGLRGQHKDDIKKR